MNKINQVIDQFRRQIWVKVENKVWFQVWDQIYDQVKNKIDIQVNQIRVREELCLQL